MMKAEFITADVAQRTTPLLVAYAVNDSNNSEAQPVLLTNAGPVLNAVSRVFATGEFKSGLHETLLLHAPAGLKAERLLVVGLGKLSGLTTSKVRQGAGTAIRFAKARAIRDVLCMLPAVHEETAAAMGSAGLTRAVAEGVVLAEMETDIYKSDRKDRSMMSATVLVSSGNNAAENESIQRSFAEGLVFAEAQNFARSLVLEPGNVLTPTELGRRAAEMCSRAGLQCEVHSTETLRELKMGAFLAVAQGSAQPPALIVMRYEPDEPVTADRPVIALVGKGITFDTGGISIKPADGMEKMKYDMAGAAAMIGAMQAMAALKPRVRVLAVICSAENMPDGAAYRPGDVVTAMSGKTIEVMNTDAEGRLVLADGLHYAKTLGATHLIDAATLTGACAVALGRLNAGMFCNDEATADRFLQAMRTAGESFWRLPCTDDYAELIKSGIADIQNTGVDRYGGAITAAMFLKEFVGETPWIHLDIAGTSWMDDARPYIAKGPTGMAVRTIAEWVRSYAA